MLRGVPGEAAATPRWYAVHTRPHHEVTAARQLLQQGFEAFLPLHWKTVRHARCFRDVKAAFFPRYLFTRLDLTRQRWRAVNGTFGVASLVMEGERPMPVPHGVVEDLAALADREGILQLGPALRIGQRVRVLSGPFADRVGELRSLGERDRVQVLLDVLGGQVSVSASSRVLAPVA